MASVYDKIAVRNGERYRKDKQFIKKTDVPAEVAEVLTFDNIVDENGTVIVEDKGTFAEGAAEEASAPANTNDNQDGGGSDENAEQPTTPPADRPNDDQLTSPQLPEEELTAPTNNPGAPNPVPSIPNAEAQRIADTRAQDIPRVFKSKTPQSNPGMGFPRKNGKTVDIFDGITPHTHVKLIGGQAVPLSSENYKTKTDAQIEARLRELGLQVIDYNKFGSPQDGD